MRKRDKVFGDVTGMTIFQVFEMAKELVASHSDADAIDLMISRMSPRQLRDLEVGSLHRANQKDSLVGLRVNSRDRGIYEKIEARIAWMNDKILYRRVAVIAVSAGLAGGAGAIATIGWGLQSGMPRNAIIRDANEMGLGLRWDDSILPIAGQDLPIPGIPDFVHYSDLDDIGEYKTDGSKIESIDDLDIHGERASGEVVGGIAGAFCAAFAGFTRMQANGRQERLAHKYARRHEPALIDLDAITIASIAG